METLMYSQKVVDSTIFKLFHNVQRFGKLFGVGGEISQMFLLRSFQSNLTDLKSDDGVVSAGVARPQILYKDRGVFGFEKRQRVSRYLPGSSEVQNLDIWIRQLFT